MWIQKNVSWDLVHLDSSSSPSVSCRPLSSHLSTPRAVCVCVHIHTRTQRYTPTPSQTYSDTDNTPINHCIKNNPHAWSIVKQVPLVQCERHPVTHRRNRSNCDDVHENLIRRCSHVQVLLASATRQGVWSMYLVWCNQLHVAYLMVTTAHWQLLQHTALHDNTRQHKVLHGNTRYHTTTHGNTVQIMATHSNTCQHTASHGITRHHTGNTLQHTETHWNTLQQDNLDVLTVIVCVRIHTHMHPRTLKPPSNTEKIQTTLLHLPHVKNDLPRQKQVPCMDKLIHPPSSPNANEPPFSTLNANVYLQCVH